MKIKIISVLRKIGLLPDPRAFLFSYVDRSGACAEIGVWKGDFTKLALKYTKPSKMYLIDPWTFQPEFNNRMFGGTVAKSQNDMDAIYASVKEEFGKNKSIIIIREKSDDAYKKIEDSSLSWLYIDGNHYRDYVKRDLVNYFPKVKVGGYIIGDDYYWKPNVEGDREVKLAVNRFCEDNLSVKLIEVKNSQFVLKRVA